MKDLFILVADKNAEYALKGALARPEALGIRPIEFEIRTHPGRDGGTRKTGPELLDHFARPHRRNHSHLGVDCINLADPFPFGSRELEPGPLALDSCYVGRRRRSHRALMRRRDAKNAPVASWTRGVHALYRISCDSMVREPQFRATEVGSGADTHDAAERRFGTHQCTGRMRRYLSRRKVHGRMFLP